MRCCGFRLKRAWQWIDQLSIQKSMTKVATTSRNRFGYRTKSGLIWLFYLLCSQMTVSVALVTNIRGLILPKVFKSVYPTANGIVCPSDLDLEIKRVNLVQISTSIDQILHLHHMTVFLDCFWKLFYENLAWNSQQRYNFGITILFRNFGKKFFQWSECYNWNTFDPQVVNLGSLRS